MPPSLVNHFLRDQGEADRRDGDGEARTLSEPPERLPERVAGTQKLVTLLRSGCPEPDPISKAGEKGVRIALGKRSSARVQTAGETRTSSECNSHGSISSAMALTA